MKQVFQLFIFGALLPASLLADSVVVFNEVMYHPLEREAGLEWVELHNQMAVDVDISGWFLGDGVSFTFPEGTVVKGGEHLVVSISPDELEQESGYADALGPYTERLSNSGESLRLFDNNGRLMDRLDYGVGGNWPVGPDGSGVSLAKVDPQSASAPSANWAPGESFGGTPGAPNFPGEPPHDRRAPIAFNETYVSADEESWVELVNHADESIQLEGFVIASQGTVVAEFTFPATSLAPGSHHVLTETELGFELEPSNRLFMVPPSGEKLSAAVRLREGLLGRFGEATGRWLVPKSPTPGAANRFAFHDEIVINEIMYHQKSTVRRPADFDFTPLLPVESVWRYDATGQGQTDPAWREPDFDDSSWPSGRALLYNESATLSGPKNTLLPLGFATYYFRTEFELAGNPNEVELALRPIIDDGAIFYLNGVEILRVNMREGEADSATLASRSVGNASFSDPVVVGGGSLVSGRNVLAVELHQIRLSSSDIVLGLEVSRRTLRRPAQAFGESPEAWIELFNRGSVAVDLSGWRMSGGIRYAFSAPTPMQPGEYLASGL